MLQYGYGGQNILDPVGLIRAVVRGKEFDLVRNLAPAGKELQRQHGVISLDESQNQIVGSRLDHQRERAYRLRFWLRMLPQHRLAELLAESFEAGGVAGTPLVELSLPRLAQTLGQLSLVEFVLRPGPPEKDEQIADRRDRITALIDWGCFGLSQEPMGEPAVDV